jgi:BarA-like signal transduction histidine kinase
MSESVQLDDQWSSLHDMVYFHYEEQSPALHAERLSKLCVTWQHECLLHIERGCSVDATQLMQRIAVGCLVMREVGNAVL